MSSHEGSSKKAIFFAIGGNFLIAVVKFIAATITSSSAMFSESIHSLVDTGNQIILLHGMKQAKKAADSKHPFGYGNQLYFWAFIVAVLIFGLGAIVSIYEGIHKILNPEPMNNVIINIVVLFAAIIIEGTACRVAFIEFKKTLKDNNLIDGVTRTKDPTIVTILFEDMAAMTGLVVALIGISISYYYNLPIVDGITSIIIGLILASTSVFLIREAKSLIIGESALPEIEKSIFNAIKEESIIIEAKEMKTVHFGPNKIFASILVDYNDNSLAKEIEDAFERICNKIKAKNSIDIEISFRTR